MSHTVIGIFDQASEAQEAKQELLNNGFDSENVDISTKDGADNSGTMPDDDRNEGIGGFFRSLFGGDSDEEEKYSRVATKGSVVTVYADSNDDAENAAEILDECGAVDVDERAGQYSNNNYNTDANLGTNQSASVIEEEMHVGKREVETGGKRLKSRIVETPVEEMVRLRSEHVSVNRNPVDREATEADFQNFKEGTMEMTEHAEKAVVSKEARVVEEVSLEKDVNETDETIKDKIRHTEVDVEDISNDRSNMDDRNSKKDDFYKDDLDSRKDGFYK